MKGSDADVRKTPVVILMIDAAFVQSDDQLQKFLVLKKTQTRVLWMDAGFRVAVWHVTRVDIPRGSHMAATKELRCSCPFPQGEDVW